MANLFCVSRECVSIEMYVNSTHQVSSKKVKKKD